MKNSFMRSQWFYLILLFMAGVFASGCASEPRFSKLSPDGTILAFGDSLTSGTDEPASSNYPAHLEAILGRRIINAGVPGEVSAEGLERMPVVLDEFKPSLVILLHGGNDLLQRAGEEGIYENLKAMIVVAKGRDAQVLLVGIPRPNIFLGDDAPFYERAARDTGVPYFRNALKHILSNGTLKSDPIHPNAEGNRKLAEGIAKFLRERSNGI